MVTWTNELATLARAVATETAAHPYGHDNTNADVMSRAREFANAAPCELKPYQREYLICFYDRLDQGRAARASHVAMRDAIRRACMGEQSE